MRTAKSCGPDISTLVSSLAEAKSALPGADQPYPWGDGGKQARSPGRARSSLLKPLRAGMLGVSGKPVVTTLVCFLPFLHARLRVHWAPGIPHALFGRKVLQASGASRRGNAELRPQCCCLKIESERGHATLCRPGM